jgi:hypothetical protein
MTAKIITKFLTLNKQYSVYFMCKLFPLYLMFSKLFYKNCSLCDVVITIKYFYVMIILCHYFQILIDIHYDAAIWDVFLYI